MDIVITRSNAGPLLQPGGGRKLRLPCGRALRWGVGLVLTVMVALSNSRSTAQTREPLPASLQATKSEAPEEAELRAAGIEPTPENCLALLVRGLPSGVDPQRLPPRPVEKTQLAVDAMAILAKVRAKNAVEPLIQIARQEFPPGIEQLLEIDLRQTAPEDRSNFRQKAAAILQYNAINALGLIGDRRALSVVRAVYDAETRTAPKIQYALSLACLGDAHGVEFLVQVIGLANRRESAAAAKAFAMITGQDFGYTDQTPIKKRKRLSKEYAEWWRAHGAQLRIDPAAVLRRRLAPEPSSMYQPRSTRDLLRLSSLYFDIDHKKNTVEARERLAAAGSALNPELEAIMFDEMEDLNIRLEAMNWYYEFNRAKARDVFKRLRRDANPEIADKASSLLEKIERPDAAGFVFPDRRGM